MPKAKPVSLHPLSFEEALKVLIANDPKNAAVIKRQKLELKRTKTKRSKTR